MRYLISMIIGSLFTILCIVPAYAESVEDIHILKISAKDERAIVKTSDGEARMVKVGDEIGSSGKVAEISSRRIVIEGAKSDEIVTNLKGHDQLKGSNLYLTLKGYG